MTELDEQVIAMFVEKELARRKWTLAAQPDLIPPGDSFAARVSRRVDEWQSTKRRARDEALVRDALVHEYCYLFHRAMGWNGSRAQAIALQETIDYAWPVALRRCADREVAESVILRAVNQAWARIGQCRQPGGYLAWFGRILQNEINQAFRTGERLDREISEAELPPAPEAEDAESGALDSFEAQGVQGHAAYSWIDLEASRPSLFAKIRRCLQNAHKEFVIQALFWGELQLREIAHVLRLTVVQVTQKKFYALRRMREGCPEVVQELILLMTP